MKRKAVGLASIIIAIIMMLYTANADLIENKNTASFLSSKENKITWQWPPLVSLLLLFGGIAILLTNQRKPS